jgi:hypothetical protein
MRKNTLEVFGAWMQGRERKRGRMSIWTDGETVYSYGTALLTRTEDGELIFNATKYSVTTSCQQNNLRELMEENYLHPVVIENVAMWQGDLTRFVSVEV